MYPKGTPIIQAVITETDPETSAQCVLDINSFAIVPKTDVKARAKMRREMLRYLELQVDMLLDGSKNTIKIEGRTA